MKPLHEEADWEAVAADASAIGELQAFYEANPEYWHLVHGHAPVPDEATQEFDARPPAEMSYSAVPMWLIRDRVSGRLIGEVSAVTDLMAPGVIHLGFFIVDKARQGSGFAAEVYGAYEAWAIAHGARWLRLGVVEGNQRAHRFWVRNGYREVRRRHDYEIGSLRHTLLVMVKALQPYTFDDYLALVPRDRPET
ncbi:MAG TPA: GNAT family N-acetyltransferase [Burkholderiaceae bacterium]|nr:GNAT family N-acetyltransferase [Burkholderiaceae bacterium]HQR70231.1 GNAT family N-acetyltransferase [Burkholderiaceae bacterium]